MCKHLKLQGVYSGAKINLKCLNSLVYLKRTKTILCIKLKAFTSYLVWSVTINQPTVHAVIFIDCKKKNSLRPEAQTSAF